MDQIAAAGPVLCFDPATGTRCGGSWLDRGLLEAAGCDPRREARGPDANQRVQRRAVRPLVRRLPDWHWQSNGQVPAFSAIYGGAIQMFGRAYRAARPRTSPCG
jgi:hypothetical protein